MTPLGEVRGIQYKGVNAFLGIPYAEPPKRFSPPTPKTPWTTPLNATSFGDVCLQPSGTDGSLLQGSENCLYANVYTPSRPGRHPVLVFIHGGSFTAGTGNDYNGTQLAASQGVVVVTINYRLGPMGFFTNKELANESQSFGGLNGVWDQIQALSWVQANIYALGGDPNAVTIFGQSAGAISVAILAVSPLAKGLFHRAIIDSGVAYGPWGTRSTAAGLKDYDSWMRSLNISTVEELRQLNASAIMLHYETITKCHGCHGRTIPSIDGKVLLSDPTIAWAMAGSGGLNMDALMLGMDTADALAEWPYFVFGALNQDSTPAEAAKLIPLAFPDMSVANITRQYPASRFGNRSDLALIVAYRDRAVHCPMNRMASWATHHIPVYQYLFGSKWPGGVLNVTKGNTTVPLNLPASFMPHGLELMQVFGKGMSSATPNEYTLKFCDKVYSEELTSTVQNFWGTFTATGAPKDPHSGAVWPVVSDDYSMPNYMYLSEPQPEYLGVPGPLLPTVTNRDCLFWEQFPFTPT